MTKLTKKQRMIILDRIAVLYARIACHDRLLAGVKLELDSLLNKVGLSP